MRSLTKTKTSNQPSFGKRLGGKWLIHLFPLPALAIYLLFIVYPIVTAFVYSLFDWDGLRRGAYIGLQNFVHLFTKKPFSDMFWRALEHNAYYFILEMIVQNGLAFLLAYILFTKIRGKGFFKIAFFVPRLLSVIVVGFLWKLILNPNTGMFNQMLKTIGLGSWAKPWLGDTNTALTAIILINSWFGIGFAMLIFLAGLQSIPAELIEAARLEGAKGFRLVRSIILPLIIPSITIITVFTFMQAFQAFELVYAMQGSDGSPFYSTDTLAVYFYRLAFGGANATEIGLGSALAVVLFVIIAMVTAIYLYWTRKKAVAL
ncbi:carbohydrate ABC transporter permease [Camelliibacillus cellulosilyticus]|uniref:Carbohydrate ABC transporter permease n=1 Tax=Camelliibacillus cellulosilyticus TaxID=2174486 RepID=A0ABV9GRA8_9BACL